MEDVGENKIVIEPGNEEYDKGVEIIKELNEREKTLFEVFLFLFALISGFIFNIFANFVDAWMRQLGNTVYYVFQIVVGLVSIIIIGIIIFIVIKFIQNNDYFYKDLAKITKKNPSSNKPKHRKINEYVETKKWKYKVKEIKISRRIKVDKSPIEYKTALGKFVLVRIEYQNIGKENFKLNSLKVLFIDSKGIEYEADDATLDLNRLYGLTKFNIHLPPNVKCESIICFDISPDSQPKGFMFQKGLDYIVDFI